MAHGDRPQLVLGVLLPLLALHHDAFPAGDPPDYVLSIMLPEDHDPILIPDDSSNPDPPTSSLLRIRMMQECSLC